MHEASLAGGILKLVEDAARRENFRRVTSIRLEAGRLAGVEVRALRFALEAIAPATCLQGARIEIDEPPGTAWCLPCGVSVTLSRRDEACPHCGSHHLQPTGGCELRVVEMQVEDP
ncbi:hydrogenase maturation nickel metallochaperone HypA [Variovorax ureilyticus]|uniref:Hydrogenase maturation factor HypA n=1 Tax=Variovorax ureilyticus TaxID=1836198 RepID=A0ABU8VPP8_9BURK